MGGEINMKHENGNIEEASERMESKMQKEGKGIQKGQKSKLTKVK
jgi:hypothetical protein